MQIPVEDALGLFLRHNELEARMEGKREGAFISSAEFPQFVQIFPFDREKVLLFYFRSARWGNARLSSVSPGRSVATFQAEEPRKLHL